MTTLELAKRIAAVRHNAAHPSVPSMADDIDVREGAEDVYVFQCKLCGQAIYVTATDIAREPA